MPVHLHNTDIAFLASTPVQICAIVQYLIGGMTLVVAPVFCYAVAYKSTREMPTYRKFMLALIPFGVLNTTLITGYQPIYFVQHQVHVSTGLFKSFGTNVLVYETMLIFAIDTFQTQILLLMLISQYFVMSKAMRKSKPKTEKIVYGFLFITSLFYCAVVVTFFCFELIPQKCGKLCLLFRANTNACFFMFQLTQTAEFCVFAVLCVRLLRNLSSIYHPTIKHHVMLTRVVLIQSVLTFLFTRPSQILMAMLFALKQNNMVNLVGLYGICSSNGIFVGVMLLGLYFVRPYRRFVQSLCKF